jgi:chemotaxis response regulator CheB
LSDEAAPDMLELDRHETAPAPPEPPDDEKEASSSFPIVGVGASAGGLEAFSQLLEAL